MSSVTEHVDDAAGRFADEEAADAPGLVGEGVDDVAAEALGGGVGGVDVVDLDGDVGVDRGGGVAGHHAQLEGAVAGGGVGRDPAHVHHLLQAEHLLAEAARGGGVVSAEIGDDAVDGHGAHHDARRGMRGGAGWAA